MGKVIKIDVHLKNGEICEVDSECMFEAWNDKMYKFYIVKDGTVFNIDFFAIDEVVRIEIVRKD
jgi:phosphosulfolactate synthase (CoM biosynthesis protein A)